MNSFLAVFYIVEDWPEQTLWVPVNTSLQCGSGLQSLITRG